MRRRLLLPLLLGICPFLHSQDSLFARRIIKYLTSPACFGRGYLKNGLDVAAKYLSEEMKALKVQPLFATGYYQWFDFNVNTFPSKVSLKLDGRTLKPGTDYIISPESGSLKGKYQLVKKDSVTYAATTGTIPLILKLKKKLTFSVSTEVADYCELDLLDKGQYGGLRTAEVDIGNRLLTKYISKNLCGFIPGTKDNDSLIVFSAHYDHLGGMGKKVFFPGANDNASGVSMVLNLAAYYARHPPAYRCLFILFAGEEARLLGSKYFTESKAVDLKKIKFMINLDLLGTGDDGIMVVNGAVYEKQFQILQKINAEQHLVKDIRKRGKAQNSDHYWFSEAGVPCFFIYTLGGVSYYHDVLDAAATLPLTDYSDVLRLITQFIAQI